MVFSIQKISATIITRSQPFELELAGPLSLSGKIPPSYSNLLLMLKYPWLCTVGNGLFPRIGLQETASLLPGFDFEQVMLSDLFSHLDMGFRILISQE